MKTEYGLQVDAGGAFVIGQGTLAGARWKLEDTLVQNLKEKKITGLTVSKRTAGLDGGGERLIIQEGLGNGGVATVAMRVAKKGTEDLEVTWRLFEKNVSTQRRNLFSQIGLVVFGLILIPLGILTWILDEGFVCKKGTVLIRKGLGMWWQGRDETTASIPEQFQSRALAQMVEDALMRALAHLGVADQDVRMLK